jgi:hypothetical protein
MRRSNPGSRSLRRGSAAVTVMAAFLLAFEASSMPAKADIISIDDSTEGVVTVTAMTNSGVPLTDRIVIMNDSSGEFLHFTFTSNVAADSTATFSTDILEPASDPDGGGSLSDRIFISQIEDSAVYEVQFGSDPATVPTGGTMFPNVTEDGTFQVVAMTTVNGQVNDVYRVKSDAVPEPASLAMLCAGGLCLAAYRLRHRRGASVS